MRAHKAFSLIFFAALAAVAVTPDRVAAQTRTLECQSLSDQRHECRVPNLDQNSVRLVRRTSDAACVNGRSWGTERGLIWVDRGCRAVFSYDTGGGGGGGDRREIRCESRNDDLQGCTVENLNQSSVRLERRLSDAACVNGRTWGTERDQIWVDRGCRAVFSYTTGGGGGGNRREIRCESQGGDLQNCRVDNLVQSSVRLERRLSDAACINGRTWGTQPNIIWVESGCRAVFSFQTGRGNVSQANLGGRREMRCESDGGDRRNCRIPNLDLGSVRMERQLSDAQCERDRSWGTQRGLIWVDRGCRAVFSYRVNN